MANKDPKVAEDPVEQVLDTLEFEPERTSAPAFNMSTATATADMPEMVPSLTDAKWTDYVLGQLEDDEKDEQGNPRITGLRRLVTLLLGDIVESWGHVIQPPSPDNGYIAVVEYQLRVDWTKDLPDGTAEMRTFGGIADVDPGIPGEHEGNCIPKIARFATSTAETRAEARACRKALQLHRVLAAEEVEDAPPAEDDDKNPFIRTAQILMMDVKCQQLDINFLAYVNAGINKFPDVRKIPYPIAKQMVRALSDLQRKPALLDKLSAKLRGYDPDWEAADAAKKKGSDS